MRTYETAAVKMAVKRSIRAGSVENGFQSLYRWNKDHPQAEMAEMLKCFRKWTRRYQGL
jgi:hypothetical protein